MRKQYNTFIEVLRAYIQNATVVLPKNIDIDNLINLSKMHSVAGIVAAVIKKNKISIADELSKKFDAYMIVAVSQSVAWDMLYKEVSEALASEKIKNIVVKGPVVKRYYPDPDLRTMGDVDLVIHRDDMPKAKDVMLQLGFNECESGGVDEWKFEKNNLHIELHEDLTSEDFGTGIDYKKEMQYIFNNVKNPDCYIQELTDECHLVYLILHIAQHLMSAGCGVRQILDIALVLKNCDIDMNEVFRTLDRLKLTDLAHTIFYLCNVWFGVKCENYTIDNDLYEDFSEHIISGGVFGFDAHREDNQQIRDSMYKRNKLRFVLKYAFPDVETMRAYVLWFRNKPVILLPVAWAYRWYRSYKDHPERVRGYVKKSMVTGDAQVEKEYEMLKKLGFYQK